jgi:transcriptional regulator with XRE-family HTH domain
MPQTAVSPAGEILRRWRAVRGKSQLDLALDADVSPRHVSFIETGRSSPSREMLVSLSDALDIPLRERNALLQAAGYAALYRETPMDAPEMAQVRRAIDAILRAHTISPAIVVNRRYDILETNAAAKMLMAGAAKPGAGGHRLPNLVRLLLSQDCLRPAIENWQELAAILIRRVLRESEAIDSLRRDLQEVIDECIPDRAAALLRKVAWTQPAEAVLPMRFRAGEISLSMFSTITTLGTPSDITLQELRIEAFHPADRKTEEFLARVASDQQDSR